MISISSVLSVSHNMILSFQINIILTKFGICIGAGFHTPLTACLSHANITTSLPVPINNFMSLGAIIIQFISLFSVWNKLSGDIITKIRKVRNLYWDGYHTSLQTQNICITFIKRRPNVFDAGPALYKCYTNVCVSWAT